METHILRPGYLTAHQTAQVLGVGLPAVRKLVQRGQLAAAPGSTARQRWYRVADVTALAADRARNGSA